MYSLLLAERVLKLLSDAKGYPAKIHRQITVRIFLLGREPRPSDAKRIGSGYRVDVGEYCILYTVDDQAHVVRVELVGSRNDDEVYRQARRLGLL